MTAMPRLPPLSALRAFEAMGRTGSVRAAAEELTVDHSVISRHIKNLEEWTGVKLIEPYGRGVALTRLGARYHDEVAEVFASLARATAELVPGTRQLFSLWCTPGLASSRLIAALPALQAKLPDHDLVLHPTLSRTHPLGGEPDAEIAYLTRPERRAGSRAELLVEPRVFPVVSPDFLERYGRPATLSDLVSLPLIHERSTHQWTSWFAKAGLQPIPLLGGMTLWHANLTVEAARLGQGVALANDLLVAADIRAGRLIELLGTDCRLGAYHLIIAERRLRDPTIFALRQWVGETFCI